VRMDELLTALGLMLVFEGVPYFVAPTSMRQWMVRVAGMPESLLRRMGLLLMVTGLGLVYWVRG
jgi:uncharacterized protein YjeT (DUF2065 family)